VSADGSRDRETRASTARLFAVSVGIWGTTWFAITFQLGRVPPEASVAWRFGLAAAIAAAFCRVRGLPLALPLRVHGQLALLGAFMFCAGYLAVYHAEARLPSGLVAVGYSTSPLVNLVTARVALRVRANRATVLGALLGLSGVTLVFWPLVSGYQARPGALAGAALTAAGVLASAVGNVFATRLERMGVQVWQKMAWGMAYGAAGCLLAGLAAGEPLAFDRSPSYVGSLLYLAVFGSIGAFAAFLTLLERVGPARAGYVGVMVPVVALFLSRSFEGLALGPVTFAGVLLAVAGNVAILKQR